MRGFFRGIRRFVALALFMMGLFLVELAMLMANVKRIDSEGGGLEGYTPLGKGKFN